MRWVVFALSTALLFGCSRDAAIEGLLTSEEKSLIEGAIGDVARGDHQVLAEKMLPEIKSQAKVALPAMRDALPRAPLKLTVAAVNVRIGGDGRVARAIYEVEGKPGWALAETLVTSEKGSAKLAFMQIQETLIAPREVNKFRLADAGGSQWAMLSAMFFAAVLTILALFRIWRSKIFHRRWLWTLGLIPGLMTFRLNWTTGDWSFQPISFQIFSMSAFKVPIFAPWVLAVSVPLVAIIVLLKRPSTKAEAVANDGPPLDVA